MVRKDMFTKIIQNYLYTSLHRILTYTFSILYRSIYNNKHYNLYLYIRIYISLEHSLNCGL